MTAIWNDYNKRQDNILAMAVEQYIRTITPVSSNYIAKHYFEDLSSATIRNILAELEAKGYLTHPHTSAGRVPTQKGYRYYVDNLMNEIQLLKEEKERIRHEYEQKSLELDKMLDRTSWFISNITQHTGIVSIDGVDDKLFCCGANYVIDYPECNDLKKIRSILKALDEKEHLLEIINRDLKAKIKILIGQETQYVAIQNCSLVISKYHMKKGTSGRIAVLGPTRMDYGRVVSTLGYISSLIEGL